MQRGLHSFDQRAPRLPRDSDLRPGRQQAEDGDRRHGEDAGRLPRQRGRTVNKIANSKDGKLPTPQGTPADRDFLDGVAGVEGLEPPTPGFGDRCSSH